MRELDELLKLSERSIRQSRTDAARTIATRPPGEAAPPRIRMQGAHTWTIARVLAIERPARLMRQLAEADAIAILEHRQTKLSRTLSAATRAQDGTWRDLTGQPISITEIEE
jgi:hypothetical protein